MLRQKRLNKDVYLPPLMIQTVFAKKMKELFLGDNF